MSWLQSPYSQPGDKIPFMSNIRRLVLSNREIAPKTYQLTIGGVNMVLIAEEQLTLVDAGLHGSTPQIIEFIRKLGRSPEELGLIILSHRHIDHIGSLAALKRSTPARVAIHGDDISDGNTPPPRSGVRHRLLQLPGSSTIRSVFGVRDEDVDIRLAGGERLEPLGGLEVIHTPGHTAGSISLYSPKHKLLLVGDALRKRRKALLLPPRSIAGFNRGQALESVLKISRLDIDTLCTGHGLPITENIPAMLRDLMERNKD